MKKQKPFSLETQEEKEQIQQLAEAAGKSVNQYIKDCILKPQ